MPCKSHATIALLVATASLLRLPPAAASGWVRADRVIVKKSQRQLLLMDNGRVVKRFRISLGKQPVGTKVREGDKRTPLGRYKLDWKNPQSRYYLSIHISYPNGRDKARAKRLGVDPGENIMIHGLPNEHKKSRRYYLHHDWTLGCIAVSDAAMQWIWMAVRPGTPIDIKP